MALMATKKAPPKRTMSAEHKAALAAGRTQGRAVRDYLDALDAIKPKRGRPRTTDSVQKQLSAVEAQLAEAKGADRVLLVQKRMDLAEELGSLAAKTDLSSVEDAFVEAAKDYSRRNGISYMAWREVGVPAAVLKRAGISRGGA
jgi:hypothetical protein